MALGVVLFSLQRGYQQDLFGYLFGNVLAVSGRELAVLCALGAGVLAGPRSGVPGALLHLVRRGGGARLRPSRRRAERRPAGAAGRDGGDRGAAGRRRAGRGAAGDPRRDGRPLGQSLSGPDPALDEPRGAFRASSDWCWPTASTSRPGARSCWSPSPSSSPRWRCAAWAGPVTSPLAWLATREWSRIARCAGGDSGSRPALRRGESLC